MRALLQGAWNAGVPQLTHTGMCRFSKGHLPPTAFRIFGVDLLGDVGDLLAAQ